MKFQIDKDVFQEALNQVQHVVSTRTTLPILSNVLIEADELGLQLSTTDLDVNIKKKPTPQTPPKLVKVSLRSCRPRRRTCSPSR